MEVGKWETDLTPPWSRSFEWMKIDFKGGKGDFERYEI